MKKKSKGKMKPYNSPGHVHDHPAFDLPSPAGGAQAGTELGQPMAPGQSMGGMPPGIGA